VVSDDGSISEAARGSMVAGESLSPRGGSSAGGAKSGWDAMAPIDGGIIVGGSVGAKVGMGSIGRGISAAVEDAGMGAVEDAGMGAVEDAGMGADKGPVGGIVEGGPVLDDTDWGANDGEALADMAV
jgi:hypothetical protein